MIMIWLKDTLLCLLICSTLAKIGKNKKTTFTSLGLVFLLLLMGFDI